MPTIDQLNQNQKEAVLWDDGPLLVLAGPGSGKTAVLTLRIARLLAKEEDAQILALTFTTKAATEMRQRLKTLTKHGNRSHLCTFHSFASELLRQHGSHIGLRPDFSLITQEMDRLAILEEIIGRQDEEVQTDIPSDRRSVLRLIDRMFGDGSTRTSESSASWLDLLFNDYCADLLAENRLDYGALLYWAVDILKSNPRIRKLQNMSWSHVCVDEFQDTNKAQYDFMRLLVPESKPNLFVVGDDDQIIYQWNGASPERLQALRRDYEMPIVQLPENFRCPAEVIELANQLIQHNSNRTPGKEKLTTRRLETSDDVVRGFQETDEHAEAAHVAKDIASRGIGPEDYAVLARTANLLHKVAAALGEANIPAYVPVRKTDFESLEAKAAFSILRLANARHDAEALRRACLSWNELTGLSLEVASIEAQAGLVGGDYLRALLDEGTTDGNKRIEALEVAAKSMLLERLDVVSFVEHLFDSFDAASGDELQKEEFETWRNLHEDLLDEFPKENVTLHLYLQEMDLRSKAPTPPKGAVQCLTIHGSKGLEFPHVYLVGMAEEVCPSWQSVKKGDDSREMEEERRNCFVAITRVQETLTLSLAVSYNGWNKRPSRFLREMGLIKDD